jgi:hypothetical protein
LYRSAEPLIYMTLDRIWSYVLEIVHGTKIIWITWNVGLDITLLQNVFLLWSKLNEIHGEPVLLQKDFDHSDPFWDHRLPPLKVVVVVVVVVVIIIVIVVVVIIIIIIIIY